MRENQHTEYEEVTAQMEADARIAAQAKPQKQKKQKKQKSGKKRIVENKGISGAGTDYTVYIMSGQETLLAVVIGFAVGFAAGYCYFDSKIVGLIVGLVAGYKAIDIFRKKKQTERLRDLRLQFRDLLESLSNSYTVGMTANRAFLSAYDDMVTEHGKNSYIANEVRLINEMHNQGTEIRDMLNDFAVRSGIDDVRSFADVFHISSELGGDVAKVIRETRDMIGDKIEIELEIQTMVTGQRSELNILAIMPIVMSLMLRAFGDGSAPSLLTIVVKAAALALFVFAYWLGTKIVDIKV